MKLLPLPALTDNYIWMLHDGRNALVVDPGDAVPVLQMLQSLELTLQAILITHHHGDHTGGITALCDATQASVYGPANESIAHVAHKLSDHAHLEVLGLDFGVIDVPGHTLGHIAYFCADVDGAPLLFCGDTLFSAGCGRLFEGTPAQMQTSLARLAALPSNTQVCCTHEYTLANLQFARAVEPDNARLASYQQHCMNLHQQGLPTLPSTIGLEREINPFLRSDLPQVAAKAKAFDATYYEQHGAFASLRQWKNNYV